MKTNVTLRKISLVAVFMCALVLSAMHAQNKIGITAQAGQGNVEVNGLGILDLLDPMIKPIPTFSTGFVYEKELNRQLALMTGATYSTRGFSMREDFNVEVMGLDLPFGARVNTKLTYIEVPLALKYNFTEQGISPFIKAGVSGAYAIDGKIQPKVDAIISWKLPAININLENDLYNRFDVSAIAGAGVSIPTNDIGSLQLEVDYRHSLNDMFLDNITDIRIKSHGFTAGIGYTIRF